MAEMPDREFEQTTRRLSLRYPFSMGEVATTLHRLDYDSEKTERILELALQYAVTPNALLDVAAVKR